MKTELDQQLQTEDALSNVQAAQPFQLVNPQLTSTLPPFYQDDAAWQGAKPKDLVTPPSTKEINKQMWVGSFMTALMVGLTTKDAGAALTGGLLGAIAIHDYGHALRKRGEHVPDMVKRGYSPEAILAYYEDGNQELLNQERDDMRANRQLDNQIRNQDRNFEEGRRRFDETSEYRDASLAQRERFQNANLSFRRQTLDMRREQLNAAMRKGQIEEARLGISPRDAVRQILTGGADPMTGKAPTAARIKQVQQWQEGNNAYRGQRNGIVTQLDKVGQLIALDMSDGTGMVAGMIPQSALVVGDGQQVRSLLSNLQSGQFTTNIAALRGMGALSEAEGARIQNLVASLDPSLGEGELRRQLEDVQRSLLTAIEQADSNAAMYQWDMPEEQPAEQPAQAEGEAPTGKRTASNGVTYEVTKE